MIIKIFCRVSVKSLRYYSVINDLTSFSDIHFWENRSEFSVQEIFWFTFNLKFQCNGNFPLFCLFFYLLHRYNKCHFLIAISINKHSIHSIVTSEITFVRLILEYSFGTCCRSWYCTTAANNTEWSTTIDLWLKWLGLQGYSESQMKVLVGMFSKQKEKRKQKLRFTSKSKLK